MTTYPADGRREDDLELVDAAEDLRSLPREIAALVGPDGEPTAMEIEHHDGLMVLRQARLDCVRMTSAHGPAGLRAKARAILADGVLDGSRDATALVTAFARDVLRLVDDRRT